MGYAFEKTHDLEKSKILVQQKKSLRRTVIYKETPI